MVPKMELHQQQQQQMVQVPNENQQFKTIVTHVNGPNNTQNIWATEGENSNPVNSIIFGPEDIQLLNGTNPNQHYQVGIC